MIAKLVRGDEPPFALFDAQACGHVGDSQEPQLRAPGWYIFDMHGNLVMDERFETQADAEARIKSRMGSGL